MKGLLGSFRFIELVACAIPGLVFGASFGFFALGYWLTDLFPVESRRLLYSTGLSCLIGTAIYTLLFLWLKRRWNTFLWQQVVTAIGASTIVGLFTLFAATDGWQSPVRYIPPFLPERTLELSVFPANSQGEVELRWFKTSLGDVSFDDLEYEGWNRKNGRLVLEDHDNNQLYWVGKTGDVVQVVFSSSVDKSDIVVSWDGPDEDFFFQSREYVILHSFSVPFYASKTWILFLGGLNFILLSFPVYLVLWGRRSDLILALHAAVEHVKNSLPREGIIVLLVLILACLLRIPNLENLPPLSDEYQQFNAAKQIIRGNPWQDVYQRSLWILTFPISLAFRVFGYEVWAARSVGAVFNILAIIPLYLIGRKITHPTAVLAILLYATSPLIIALARIAREYAYYPFYFYWILYGLIAVLQKIRDHFHGRVDWSGLLAPRYLWLGLGLVIPPVYALYVDTFSTFKIILVAYVMFGVSIVFLMVNLRNRFHAFAMLVALGILVAGVYMMGSTRFSIGLGFDASPIYYFFPNPPQQWYFNRFVFIPGVGMLAGITAGILIWRDNFVPVFFTLLFAGFLGFFVFLSVESREPRHLSTALLCYIVLLAFGLHVLWLYLQTVPFFQKRAVGYLTMLLVTMASMNGPQILVPVTFRDSYLPITEHYHPELGQLHEFLLAHASENDAIITTNVYLRYAEWQDALIFSRIHIFDTSLQSETIAIMMAQYDSGWIIFDKIWINQLPFSPFLSFSENRNIEYIGLFGDEHLWRWKRK